MPELPEVETVRQRLAPVLTGRRFAHVAIDDERLVRPFDPREIEAELVGEQVAGVERRGKYLIVRFVSGRSLLIHLRMTGSFRHRTRGLGGADRHRRAVVRLDDGSDVIYRDVRRFGTWLLIEPDQLDPYLASRLGGEPLERSFTSRSLAGLVSARRAPIKAALLDQRVVPGMGNIYADEALWRARIHPQREAQSLDPDEIARLTRGIKDALRLGIRRQGATLRDYAQPDGSRGKMQEAFKVYGRGGDPCERCGTPIEKTRIAGRGTWYCPACQSYAASRSSRRPSRSRRHSSV